MTTLCGVSGRDKDARRRAVHARVSLRRLRRHGPDEAVSAVRGGNHSRRATAARVECIFTIDIYISIYLLRDCT